MILFLAFSIPLFWLFTAFSHWEREISPDRLAWFRIFLRGATAGIAGFLVLSAFRAVAGFAWRPAVLLYVSVLVVDHLAPMLLPVAGTILLMRRITAGRRGGALFLAVFSFLCGWFSTSGLIEAVSSWGRGDPYALVLMPLLRVAEILAASLILERFHPWDGRDALLAAAAAAAIALAAAVPSFLYDMARRGFASILAGASVVAALLVLIGNFPRVFLDRFAAAAGVPASGTAPRGASGATAKAVPVTAPKGASGRAPLLTSRRKNPPAGRTGPGRRA